MRTYLTTILIVSILTACDTGYEGIVRDPALRELETKLISDLECEDAIITAGYDSIGATKGQAIRLIFINSKKVNLSDTDKENDEWCFSISDKFVDNFLEKPYKYDFIQVKFVERKGLVFRATRHYGHMYMIGSFDNDSINQNTKMSDFK